MSRIYFKPLTGIKHHILSTIFLNLNKGLPHFLVVLFCDLQNEDLTPALLFECQSLDSLIHLSESHQRLLLVEAADPSSVFA
jgi:hypothetical protein